MLPTRVTSSKPDQFPYVVRVALYRDQNRALNNVLRLRRIGVPATWQTVTYRKTGAWYGVYVGRFSDRARARRFAAELLRSKNAEGIKLIRAPYAVEVKGQDAIEQRTKKLVNGGHPVYLFPSVKETRPPRIFVGIFGIGSRAKRIERQLRAQGYQATVVRP